FPANLRRRRQHTGDAPIRYRHEHALSRTPALRDVPERASDRRARAYLETRFPQPRQFRIRAAVLRARDGLDGRRVAELIVVRHYAVALHHARTRGSDG